jgi:hypothetical protein
MGDYLKRWNLSYQKKTTKRAYQRDEKIVAK